MSQIIAQATQNFAVTPATVSEVGVTSAVRSIVSTTQKVDLMNAKTSWFQMISFAESSRWLSFDNESFWSSVNAQSQYVRPLRRAFPLQRQLHGVR
jgi:hypothetical protein